MADRFPSIEDIDAGDTNVGAGTSGGDFLERERAALGNDADLFSSTNDQKAQVQDADEDDLLGGDDDFSAPAQPTSGGNDDLDGFESSFPAIDTRNDSVGPGGQITSTPSYTNYQPQPQADDTEPIRAWREKRDADIARRDTASKSKKEETVKTAQQDIDSFYETYNRKADKQKAQTQKEAEEFLAKREDTTAGGTSWERIAKLVDLSGKGQVGGGEGSSKQRMREMLISLKNDKEAPGVAGI